MLLLKVLISAGESSERPEHEPASRLLSFSADAVISEATWGLNSGPTATQNHDDSITTMILAL